MQSTTLRAAQHGVRRPLARPSETCRVCLQKNDAKQGICFCLSIWPSETRSARHIAHVSGSETPLRGAHCLQWLLQRLTSCKQQLEQLRTSYSNIKSFSHDFAALQSLYFYAERRYALDRTSEGNCYNDRACGQQAVCRVAVVQKFKRYRRPMGSPWTQQDRAPSKCAEVYCLGKIADSAKAVQTCRRKIATGAQLLRLLLSEWIAVQPLCAGCAREHCHTSRLLDCAFCRSVEGK